MPIFVSQGTISIADAGGNVARPQQDVVLHFAPSHDYSIEHWGKKFAVFVSQFNRPLQAVGINFQAPPYTPLRTREDVFPLPMSHEAFVREYDKLRVIEVNTNMRIAHLPSAITSAASNQTNVQIRVDASRPDFRTLELVGIESPAT